MMRGRLQRFLNPDRSYERLRGEDQEHDGMDEGASHEEPHLGFLFSWLEYAIFLWMGVSMLWAWNMFLAAAPYFQRRFGSNPWIMTNFQPSILSVSCITNLTTCLVLAKRQKNANYARRISASVLLNIVVFTLLALSTVLYHDVASERYFVFVLIMAFAASLATGMNQNGMFAYVASFGRSEYTQAVMVGQGVAGVLPCVVQMIAVLAVPDTAETLDEGAAQYQSGKSAFIYFATATGVSAVAIVAFLYLDRAQQAPKNTSKPSSPPLEMDEEEVPLKESIPLRTLFCKLRWGALAMFSCFTITMVFPVFTAAIHSVREIENPAPPRLFQPAAFIPLAFLVWNSGDLIGRMAAGNTSLNKLIRRPFLLFVSSLARILFIPLYLMCNIRGEGTQVPSDLFYLFGVQLLFGFSNGYLCSSCMIGAAQWVEEEDREAAGVFMSLMLAAGLTGGSLLSFAVAKF